MAGEAWTPLGVADGYERELEDGTNISASYGPLDKEVSFGVSLPTERGQYGKTVVVLAYNFETRELKQLGREGVSRKGRERILRQENDFRSLGVTDTGLCRRVSEALDLLKTLSPKR